jgi:hypothetical protein
VRCEDSRSLNFYTSLRLCFSAACFVSRTSSVIELSAESWHAVITLQSSDCRLL